MPRIHRERWKKQTTKPPQSKPFRKGPIKFQDIASIWQDIESICVELKPLTILDDRYDEEHKENTQSSPGFNCNWKCQKCLLFNKFDHRECFVCGTKKSTSISLSGSHHNAKGKYVIPYQSNFQLYGFELELRIIDLKSHVLLCNLLNDSISHSVGLRNGQCILEVNGMSVNGFPLPIIRSLLERSKSDVELKVSNEFCIINHGSEKNKSKNVIFHYEKSQNPLSHVIFSSPASKEKRCKDIKLVRRPSIKSFEKSARIKISGSAKPQVTVCLKCNNRMDVLDLHEYCPKHRPCGKPESVKCFICKYWLSKQRNFLKRWWKNRPEIVRKEFNVREEDLILENFGIPLPFDVEQKRHNGFYFAHLIDTASVKKIVKESKYNLFKMTDIDIKKIDRKIFYFSKLIKEKYMNKLINNALIKRHTSGFGRPSSFGQMIEALPKSSSKFLAGNLSSTTSVVASLQNESLQNTKSEKNSKEVDEDIDDIMAF